MTESIIPTQEVEAEAENTVYNEITTLVHQARSICLVCEAAALSGNGDLDEYIGGSLSSVGDLLDEISDRAFHMDQASRRRDSPA